MENLKEILSYSALGVILGATMVPLIGLLIASRKEKEKLNEINSTKKPENRVEKGELIHV